MRSYHLTTRDGRIQSGEIDFIWEPNEIDSSKDPLVLLHGSGSANYSNFAKGNSWASSMLGPMAAFGGRMVIAGWMANQSFANDAVMSRIDTALTLLGASSAHLFGISMGGGIAVRYASLNPSKTSSIMGVTPLADIDAIYQANRLSLRADIGTAWGVTYPAALPSQSNLIDTHAPVVASNGTPRRLLYSTADTSTLPAEVEELATALNITPEIIDTTLGHVEGTVGKAMNLDPSSPWKDYLDWIDGLDAA